MRDGEPKACKEYAHDQKQQPFRKAMKKWREAGWSKSASRAVARSECSKPTST